ncbi:MAG: hypothetical protein CML31_08005 [Rhizobiales bacterium]|nr:hypothetical protein [Hyphomicrobiales bacterium]|tara:strand:- start:79 stop:1182 length:1104 start_codon:yes stop_codon:yes gene_type:complete
MRCFGILFAVSVIFVALFQEVAISKPFNSREAASEDKKIAGEDDDVLRIGVRTFAQPFSYRSGRIVRAPLGPKIGPLGREGYTGYMIYICDEILMQMMIPKGDSPIITENEIKAIDIDRTWSKALGDRLGSIGESVDIICDPASISRDRVNSFLVSPPLFATGIGYLRFPEKLFAEPCDKASALIGAVGSTNAVQRGIRSILEAGEWAPHRRKIETALRGENPCFDAKGGAERRRVSELDTKCDVDLSQQVIWEADNHAQLAECFCRGKVHYYVGDFEIIKAHADSIPGCKYYASANTFTSDRYAIFAVNETQNTDKARKISKFFEILNREVVTSDSLLDRAYLSEFGEDPKSPALNSFFWSMRGTP